MTSKRTIGVIAVVITVCAFTALYARVTWDLIFAQKYCEKICQDISVSSSRCIAQGKNPDLTALRVSRPIKHIDEDFMDLVAHGLACSIRIDSLDSGWEWSVKIGNPPISASLVHISEQGYSRREVTSPRHRIPASLLQRSL